VLRQQNGQVERPWLRRLFIGASAIAVVLAVVGAA